MITSSSVIAQHHGHGHWHNRGNGNWMWLAPTVIGGVVGYEIARQQSVIVKPQPIIVPQQNCSPWTEIMNSDGTITRTRTCIQ